MAGCGKRTCLRGAQLLGDGLDLLLQLGIVFLERGAVLGCVLVQLVGARHLIQAHI